MSPGVLATLKQYRRDSRPSGIVGRRKHVLQGTSARNKLGVHPNVLAGFVAQHRHVRESADDWARMTSAPTARGSDEDLLLREAFGTNLDIPRPVAVPVYRFVGMDGSVSTIYLVI